MNAVRQVTTDKGDQLTSLLYAYKLVFDVGQFKCYNIINNSYLFLMLRHEYIINCDENNAYGYADKKEFHIAITTYVIIIITVM